MAPRPQENHAYKGKRLRVTWPRFLKAIAHLRETGQKTLSCELAGMKYDQVVNVIRERWEAGDKEWRELWDNAYIAFCEGLETESVRRGRDGWEEPVFYKGDDVGTIRRFSDRQLELQLKRHMRDQYSENVRHDHTGNVTVTAVRPGLDVFARLSLEAKVKVREIILQDLRAQASLGPAAPEDVPDASDEQFQEGEFTAIEHHPSDEEWEDEPSTMSDEEFDGP